MDQKELKKLAEDIVHKSLKAGSEESEVYIIRDQDLSIEVSNSQIETMKTAQSYGAGIRVILGNKMGYAYTSDFSETHLDDMIEAAINNAKMTAPDEANVLPETQESYPELDLYDSEIEKASVEEKINIAMELENSAKKYDPRIKITESCTYQDSLYDTVIFNSKGLHGYYKGAYCGAYAFLVAEENGESQTGFSVQYELKFKDIDPKKIGSEAAEKAIRMLGAKNIGTQKATIVLDPYVATSFLGVLSPALLAESVQKGKSLFAGKLGQDVFSPLITIVDDGKLQGGILSAPFDGEGIPTQKTVIFDKGNLKTFLHNSYTAKKDGVSSTGNATRGSYKSTPEVGTTNLYIDKGNITRENLIKDVQKGFYITEVMGMHTANPISGDFSVGAAGIWIENGKFKEPVRGVAIAGNIVELFKSIEAVADDLTFFVGKGSPTIRIAQMTISGS